MANAIAVLAEAVTSNYQLSSKVDDVFAKLISIRMDCDKVFKRHKDLLKEKNDLASKVESSAEYREELHATVAKFVKVIVDL